MQAGYQRGNERAWWWEVAKLLDATHLAMDNAIAHNVNDPTLLLAFGYAISQAQAILLEIFHAKGLLPSQPNGSSVGVPPPSMSGPAVPAEALGGASPFSAPLSGMPPASWTPQFGQAPPQFSQGGVPPPPPQFAQGPQMPPPPAWMPDFSQMSSVPQPTQEPPTEAAPPSTEQAAAVEDSPPESPPIVPESPAAGPEVEA